MPNGQFKAGSTQSALAQFLAPRGAALPPTELPRNSRQARRELPLPEPGSTITLHMLHRVDYAGRIFVSQPAHSWISGQLARAWGNANFSGFEPAEQVVCAAALHDIGFLEADRQPILNPQTGWPHTFLDLPNDLHLEIWRKGIAEMRLINRYSAVLVSLHYTGLIDRYGKEKDRSLYEPFLAEQRHLRKRLIAELAPSWARHCEPEALTRNQDLLATWDWLSLMICMGGKPDPRMSSGSGGRRFGTLCVEPLDPEEGGILRLVIEPWPFREPAFRLEWEGRLLRGPYANVEQLKQAWQAAPLAAQAAVLAPRGVESRH